MVYIKSYKDLIVWQRAMELAKAVFELTSFFPKSELYGLVSQMRRVVVSIVSNIAEGYGRRSVKEYSQFYAIAYGSALELETQLMLSKSLLMASKESFKSSDDLLLEVLKMLHSIINKLPRQRRGFLWQAFNRFAISFWGSLKPCFAFISRTEVRSFGKAVIN